MALLSGKVAFVTGAARGQGRSHAIRLAREGASIIAVDINGPVSSDNVYPPSTDADLAETVRLVEDEDGRIFAKKADVRDLASLQAAVKEGVAELGDRLDIVVANAGISNWSRFWEMSEDQWDSTIEVNLSGVWRTLTAAAPTMISAGNGGSIITISSAAGIKSMPGFSHYSAAKRGVVALTNSAAIELGPYGIRVNSIHPWAVHTEMEASSPEHLIRENPTYASSFGWIMQDLPVAEPSDISDGVVWLASDLSRTVTGTQLSLDMGATKV